MQPLADLIESLPVPVVAAIHGYCLGGGLELALACDLRPRRTGATARPARGRLGLLPGGGGTQRARGWSAPGRAAWLIMSGERLDAPRAERGASSSSSSTTSTRASSGSPARSRRRARPRSRAEAAASCDPEARSDALELAAFAGCVASADGREGVAAFLEKRAPAWPGQ